MNRIVHGLDKPDVWVVAEPMDRPCSPQPPLVSLPRRVPHPRQCIPEMAVFLQDLLLVPGLDVLLPLPILHHDGARAGTWKVQAETCAVSIQFFGATQKQTLEIYPLNHRIPIAQVANSLETALRGHEQGGRSMRPGSVAEVGMTTRASRLEAFQNWTKKEVEPWIREDPDVLRVEMGNLQEIDPTVPKAPHFGLKNTLVYITFFGPSCLRVARVEPKNPKKVEQLQARIKTQWELWPRKDAMMAFATPGADPPGNGKVPIGVWLQSRRHVASVHEEESTAEETLNKVPFEVVVESDHVAIFVRPGNGTVKHFVVRPRRDVFEGTCSASIQERFREDLLEEFRLHGEALGLPTHKGNGKPDTEDEDHGQPDPPAHTEGLPALPKAFEDCYRFLLEHEELYWEGGSPYIDFGCKKLMARWPEHHRGNIAYSRFVRVGLLVHAFPRSKKCRIVLLPGYTTRVPNPNPSVPFADNGSSQADTTGAAPKASPADGVSGSPAIESGSAAMDDAVVAAQDAAAESDSVIVLSSGMDAPPNVQVESTQQELAPEQRVAQPVALVEPASNGTGLDAVASHVQEISAHVLALQKLGCTTVDVSNDEVHLTFPIQK